MAALTAALFLLLVFKQKQKPLYLSQLTYCYFKGILLTSKTFTLMKGINLLGIKNEQRSNSNCSTHFTIATLNPNYSCLPPPRLHLPPISHSAPLNYFFIVLYQLLDLFNHCHPTAALT